MLARWHTGGEGPGEEHSLILRSAPHRVRNHTTSDGEVAKPLRVNAIAYVT